ncbi:MAG: hypothetical protein MJ151_00035 [Lachnospiraceae bacterium]|nr:hypothetical protein [Lachnospiraceae bacterium]
MVIENKKTISKKTEKNVNKKEVSFDVRGNYKNGIRIATLLACTALVVSAIALFVLYNMGYRNTAYTIYIGSADKDTGKMELSASEAKDKIAQVFEKEGEGFTMYTADGGYFNNATNTYDRSISYVIYTSVTTKKKLDRIMNELMVAINTDGAFAHRSPSISYYTELE